MGFRTYLTQSAKVVRQFREDVSGTLQPTFTAKTVHPGLPCRVEDITLRLTNTVIGRFPDATSRIFLGEEAADVVKTSDVLEVSGERFFVQSLTRVKGRENVHHLEIVARRTSAAT